VSTTFLILFTAQVFTQTPISAEKRALIIEISKLSGRDAFIAQVDLKSPNIGNTFLTLAENEQGLAEMQRTELKQLSIEAGNRIEKNVQEFSRDSSIIATLFDDAIVREYDQNFTEQELSEMAAFYRTPTGRKALTLVSKLNEQARTSFAKSLNTKFQDHINILLGKEWRQLRARIIEMKREPARVEK
jgi:hypothetical protein